MFLDFALLVWFIRFAFTSPYKGFALILQCACGVVRFVQFLLLLAMVLLHFCFVCVVLYQICSAYAAPNAGFALILQCVCVCGFVWDWLRFCSSLQGGLLRFCSVCMVLYRLCLAFVVPYKGIV